MSDQESPSSSPADDDDDTIARFSADLRKIRLEAESPTLAKLQSATGISRSVISEAFSGRTLASARTVDGLVRACDQDPDPWVARRDALAETRVRDASASPAETAPPGVADPASAPAPAVAVLRVRTAVWIAVGAFAAGLVGSALLTVLLVPALIHSRAAAPLISATAGDDPGRTPCLADAAVAAASTRADGSLLQIVWSDACQAGWGRITRYDGLETGNSMSIAIYPQDAPYGDLRQEATERDVQNAYTTLVVRPTPDTLLCAVGSFTVEGTVTDLGEPLCL